MHPYPSPPKPMVFLLYKYLNMRGMYNATPPPPKNPGLLCSINI